MSRFLSKPRIELLRYLNDGNVAYTKGNDYPYRWYFNGRTKSGPSLANKYLAGLFQAGMVTEQDGYLEITATGKIVVEREIKGVEHA